MVIAILTDTVSLGWIYPVIQYWCWSGPMQGGKGWLMGLHFHDFAGSGVVHLLGGTCGLVGCALIGPRAAIKSTAPIGGHSKPLAAIGGAILLLGFLGFNGGSTVIQWNNCNIIIASKERE